MAFTISIAFASVILVLTIPQCQGKLLAAKHPSLHLRSLREPLALLQSDSLALAAHGSGHGVARNEYDSQITRDFDVESTWGAGAPEQAPVLTSSWTVAESHECGGGVKCGADNYLHIGPEGARYQNAPRNDVSACKTLCEAHSECGGFNWVEKSIDGKELCYFRKDTQCDVVPDPNRDCYVAPGQVMADAPRRWEVGAVKPLLLKHMSKTGGVFMKQLFEKVMAGIPFISLNETNALTEKRRGSSFVIAGVRNPCDYYVSLWAYQSTKPWVKNGTDEEAVLERDMFFSEGNSNATKFMNWLSWVQGSHNSVMTYRFFETLVDKKEGLTCWGRNVEHCQEDFNDAAVDKAMSTFKPSSEVDCWVRAENFLGDIVTCLKLYESVAGVTVHWEALEKFTGYSMNGSEHGPCEDYYNQDMADNVLQKDRRMFEAFGYSTCCGPATQPIK